MIKEATIIIISLKENENKIASFETQLTKKNRAYGGEKQVLSCKASRRVTLNRV